MESDDFKIKKLKDNSKELPDKEQIIMNKLFYEMDEVSLNGITDLWIEIAFTTFKNSLESKYSKLINSGNNFKFLWFLILIVLSVLGYSYWFYQIKLPEDFIFIIFSVSFSIFLLVVGLPMIIEKSIGVKLKPYLQFIYIIIAVTAIILLSYYLAQYALFKQPENKIALILFMILSIISLYIYKYLIKYPSKEKLRLKSLIEGFKMYMKTGEEQQIQYFNPPNFTPEIFEKLLPYAIALELEGIGFDNLPNEILHSTVFNGNELAMLANVETLPIGNYSSDESIHTMAKKLLKEKKVEEAWNLLIMN